MVPASKFRYGSILIEATFNPIVFSKRPVEEAITPFPIPEMTPPDTSTYFILVAVEGAISSKIPSGLSNPKRRLRQHVESKEAALRKCGGEERKELESSHAFALCGATRAIHR